MTERKILMESTSNEKLRIHFATRLAGGGYGYRVLSVFTDPATGEDTCGFDVTAEGLKNYKTARGALAQAEKMEAKGRKYDRTVFLPEVVESGAPDLKSAVLSFAGVTIVDGVAYWTAGERR